MVMTLRKRTAPPPRRSPSPSSSSSYSDEETTRPKSKKTRVVKSKRKPKFAGKENAYPYSSGSDSGSGLEDENVYEKIREQRIKENKERMQKLGIFALSSQFNNVKRPSKNTSIKKKRNPPLYPRQRSPDYRRSDRIKKEPRGNYFETEGSLKGMGITIPDAWKSEVYTEEDEKLLGSSKTEWTLNVDGFGEDGERLYDPVNGTSCHQCRQKTIRKHTFCAKCRSPTGRICGDCLYTRYGENVLETTEDPTWMCPACRGICNCSRCRRAMGWPPVNMLYQKVTESGFKSVAHYLIFTKRAGAMTKEPEEETAVVDLTEDTQAPLRYEGSDTSAEWSESDGDDSDEEDSTAVKKNAAQSVDNQTVAAEVPVVAAETPAQAVESPAVVADASDEVTKA